MHNYAPEDPAAPATAARPAAWKSAAIHAALALGVVLAAGMAADAAFDLGPGRQLASELVFSAALLAAALTGGLSYTVRTRRWGRGLAVAGAGLLLAALVARGLFQVQPFPPAAAVAPALESTPAGTKVAQPYLGLALLLPADGWERLELPATALETVGRTTVAWGWRSRQGTVLLSVFRFTVASPGDLDPFENAVRKGAAAAGAEARFTARWDAAVRERMAHVKLASGAWIRSRAVAATLGAERMACLVVVQTFADAETGLSNVFGTLSP